MTPRRSISALAAIALGVMTPLAIGAAAHAEVAGVPAPGITPNPVAQDGAFAVDGIGCADADGPGDVTLSVEYPDGTVDEAVTTTTANDDGTWTQQLAPEQDTVVAGSYQIYATCDMYADSFDYPVATLKVKALPSNAPAIAVNDSTLVVTQNVTVSVTGFGGDEDLTVVLHSAPVTLGTMHTDLFGAASATFAIPAGTPAGTHTIVVTNAAGLSVQITITVSNQSVTAAGAKKGGPTLADTGVDTAPYGIAAGALLLSGLGALTLGRRRSA